MVHIYNIKKIKNKRNQEDLSQLGKDEVCCPVIFFILDLWGRIMVISIVTNSDRTVCDCK